MKDAVFYAASEFLKAFEDTFELDWDHSKGCFENTQFLIGEGCTFLRPGVEDESNSWGSRGSLLQAYRRLRVVLDLLGYESPVPGPELR
jgi:hypothetical protein